MPKSPVISSDNEDVDDPLSGQSSSDSDMEASQRPETMLASGHESDIEAASQFKSTGQPNEDSQVELQGGERIPAYFLNTRPPKKKDFDIYEDQSFPGLSAFIKRHVINSTVGIQVAQSDRYGFNVLLDCIKKCLLTHRWHEASQVLEIMWLYPKHQREDALWKYGMEILYNHPDSTQALVEQFTRNLGEIFVQRKRKLVERGLYFLSKGQLKEAEMTLMSSKCMTRSGKNLEEFLTEEYWTKTINAYLGMLQYVELKGDYMVPDSMKPDPDTAQEAQDKLPEIKQACENLGAVISLPGVWDIFVTKQVELLEMTRRFQEAKEVLENYCSSCPDNPNAYRYLYRHLKGTNSDREDMIFVLKEYVQRVPSDILALDLVSLLQQSAKKDDPNYSNNVAMITSTLFNMLDYSCWYKRLPPWKALSKYAMKIAKKQDRVAMDAVRMCWMDRDWWLAYHFNPKAAKALLKKNKKVALYKTMAFMIIQTTDSLFVAVVRKYYTKKRDKKSSKQLDIASMLAKKCTQLGLR